MIFYFENRQFGDVFLGGDYILVRHRKLFCNKLTSLFSTFLSIDNRNGFECKNVACKSEV